MMHVRYIQIRLFPLTSELSENIKSTTVSIKLYEFSKIPHTTIHTNNDSRLSCRYVNNIQQGLTTLVLFRHQQGLTDQWIMFCSVNNMTHNFHTVPEGSVIE